MRSIHNYKNTGEYKSSTQSLVELLVLESLCWATPPCSFTGTTWTVKFSIALRWFEKSPWIPQCLAVLPLCGCFLALRQCRWYGIMPDSNLLVHEGRELSAWVAFCMVAVPHVLCLCWKWSMFHTLNNCSASWNQHRWSVHFFLEMTLCNVITAQAGYGRAHCM